jgi:Putative transposase, YhgA-like
MVQTNDLLWKGIIEDLTEDFVLFFFASASSLIDFSRGFEFLDTELAQLFPETESQNRHVDKLIKVYLKNGNEAWFLIHVEVQGYKDPLFTVRMFEYFYRIRDRFQKEVISLAIFTDNDLDYCPNKFEHSFFGTDVMYRFPSFKVISQNKEFLEQSDNPFAIVVLSVLVAIEKGKKSDKGLFEIKWSLVRLLLQKNYPKLKIKKILEFINYYIKFADEENERIFANKIETIIDQNTKSMGISEIILMQATEKGIEKGVNIGIEKGVNIGIEKGVNIGIEKGEDISLKKQVIKAHLKGFDNNFIANYHDISIEKVRQILDEYHSILDNL